MRKLVHLAAASCTLFVLSLSAHAHPAQQQQSKGAPIQQAKPMFKGAHVAPVTQQSVGEIYQRLMKQQPTQQAGQSK